MAIGQTQSQLVILAHCGYLLNRRSTRAVDPSYSAAQSEPRLWQTFFLKKGRVGRLCLCETLFPGRSIVNHRLGTWFEFLACRASRTINKKVPKNRNIYFQITQPRPKRNSFFNLVQRYTTPPTTTDTPIHLFKPFSKSIVITSACRSNHTNAAQCTVRDNRTSLLLTKSRAL
jgi:hypothetical protein